MIRTFFFYLHSWNYKCENWFSIKILTNEYIFLTNNFPLVQTFSLSNHTNFFHVLRIIINNIYGTHEKQVDFWLSWDDFMKSITYTFYISRYKMICFINIKKEKKWFERWNQQRTSVARLILYACTPTHIHSFLNDRGKCRKCLRQYSDINYTITMNTILFCFDRFADVW